jgi:hypothetical protein
MSAASHGAPLAHPLSPGPSALLVRSALAAATLATAAVAVWLLVVSRTVLPASDPPHVTQWTLTAAGFLGYAALTGVFVLRGARTHWLVPAVALGSLAAIAFGAWGVTSTLGAAHFEGYLLVMGVILAGHGLCALAWAAISVLQPSRPAS